MKKILYIHHATGWGGAPSSMIHLINKLDKNLFEIEVLLLKESIVANQLRFNKIKFTIAKSLFYRRIYKYFPNTEANHIKYYQVFRFTRLFFCWLLSKYFFAKRELENLDFDIIHLNSSVLTDWLMPAKKRGKVIMHIREPFRNQKLNLLSFFFRNQIDRYADKIIAISEDNATRLKLVHKTLIVYNIFNLDATEIDLGTYRSKKFLYVGGMNTIKGFFTLIKALEHIDKDIKIFFAGNYRAAKDNKIKLYKFFRFFFKEAFFKDYFLNKMRLNNQIIEVGVLDDIGEYLKQVVCLIVPQTVPHFSKPIIEANLFKKPAIVSNVDGMQELVIDNITGMFFKSNDPKSLANKINYLANNPNIAKRLGKAGYEISYNKFIRNNNIDYASIYQHI